MVRPRHLPDVNRLNVLAAIILLAYTLARLINLPERVLALQLPGLYLEIQLSEHTFVALMVAALTATGADWLLRDHPALGQRKTIEHWLLPALTAWVIGFPLSQLPLGPAWWGSFLVGGILLILVLVAEYIAVDPEDIRQPPAAAGLTAVSFALFLALAVSLRFSGLRLFLVLPALSLACGLVSLRTLHLRLHGHWAFLEAGFTALIIAQMVAALQYWPVSPITYGLVLLGPAYGLTSLIAGLAEGQPLRRAAVEPLIVLLIVWSTAIWIR